MSWNVRIFGESGCAVGFDRDGDTARGEDRPHGHIEDNARFVDAAHVGVRHHIVAGCTAGDVEHAVAGDMHAADDPRAVEGPIGRAIAVIEVGPAMQARIIETDMCDRFIG